MKSKRAICLILSLMMLLSLFSVSQAHETAPAAEKAFPFSGDEELLLAYEMGFVPEPLWDD